MGQQQTKTDAFRHAANVLSPDQLQIIKKQYRHLASRAEDDETIDKDTFLKFIPLPGMLGERLFRVCDRDHDNAIDFEEFVSAVALLVHGSEEERYRLLYDMYNLSGDNGISRDELVTMFNSIRGDTVPDPELPEQLADMDKAALDELARRTLDELADLDQRIAGSLVNPESIYTLLEQKAAKELLLSRIGLDALEAYRATHETLQDTLQTMAEEALRTCGRVRSGKLNFAQFCVWLKANPLAVDSIFKSEAIVELQHRIQQAPTLRSLERATAIDEDTMFGYLIKGTHNRRGNDRRFYFLQDHFLYEYKNEKAALSYTPAPREAIFLRGCHILSDLHMDDSARASPLDRDLLGSARISVRDRDRTRSRDRRLARSRSRERLETDLGMLGLLSTSPSGTLTMERYGQDGCGGTAGPDAAVAAPNSARLRQASAGPLSARAPESAGRLAQELDGPAASLDQVVPPSSAPLADRNATSPPPAVPDGAAVAAPAGRPALAASAAAQPIARRRYFDGHGIDVGPSVAAPADAPSTPPDRPRSRADTGDGLWMRATSPLTPFGASPPLGAVPQLPNRGSASVTPAPDSRGPASRATSSAVPDDVEYAALAGPNESVEGLGSAAGAGGSGAASAAAAADTKYRIEIVYGQHRETHVVLYAESQSSFEKWVNALEAAAETRHIEDYYEIDYGEELGRGFFADVYLCYALVDGRPDMAQRFACKIIYKTDMNELQTEMFRNEVACLRLVRHPNIVRMLAMFETPEKVYLVMELLEGGSVLNRIERDGGFAKDKAVHVIKQVLEGIDYLHECGIIHRDLKPGNLVFTSEREDAVVKIVDFGLSTFATETDNLSAPVGTLKYLAPELVLKKGYNREVDLWCIGILTYILLTNTFPFDGRTQQELLQNIINAKFNMSVPAWHEMDPAARDFIRRLLHRDPQRRMTAKDALEHPWITGAAFSAGTVSASSSMMSPSLPPSQPPSTQLAPITPRSGASAASVYAAYAALDGAAIEALPPLPPPLMPVPAHHPGVPTAGTDSATSAAPAPTTTEPASLLD